MLTAVLLGLYAFITIGLFTHASLTLAWLLYTWRSPHASTRAGFRFRRSRPRHNFSLLVPARHEEAVLEETLVGLAESHHPDFEILAIVGRDDPGTNRVAEVHRPSSRPSPGSSRPLLAKEQAEGTEHRPGRGQRRNRRDL